MEIRELLRKGLEEPGYIPEADLLSAFIIYLSELKKWNKAYNLTSLRKDEDIVIKHFLDSLLYLNVMPHGEIKVADIGSGAGFPGIPIKIIRPEIKMYLVEPSGKKSAFLRHIIKFLQLQNIEVIEERVENIKESFLVDVAVTRALFTIEDFIKKVSHIVKHGGLLIHSKGPKVKEDLQRIKDVKYEIIPCNLPLTKITRYIVAVSL